MDHATTSLQDLMNRMASHLDDILPEDMQNAPVDQDWPLIHLYLGVDAVLAGLYKQYCDARARLNQLRAECGPHAPMTEVAADMKDSLHAAMETRLIELQEDDETQQVLARQPTPTIKKPLTTPVEAFDQMMAFMIWARMTLKNAPRTNVRRQFRIAA